MDQINYSRIKAIITELQVMIGENTPKRVNKRIRLTDEEIEKKILEFVQNNDGLYFLQIYSKLGLGYNKLRFFLSLLVSEKKLDMSSKRPKKYYIFRSSEDLFVSSVDIDDDLNKKLMDSFNAS